MMKKIENLLKTSYARITTSEEPNEKKWVFSSVHNRAFNYNSSALFEYVKKYHPEIQAFYVMEDPVERKNCRSVLGRSLLLIPALWKEYEKCWNVKSGLRPLHRRCMGWDFEKNIVLSICGMGYR